MAMNKSQVKNVTKGKSTKTVMYFKEVQEDGFAMISSKLIRSGKMAEIGGALATLLALIDSANTVTGQCNPSVQKLAQMTGKSERSVITDINKLIDLGYIEKIQAAKVGGKHKYTNNYIITVFDTLEGIKASERVEVVQTEEPIVEEKQTKKEIMPIAISKNVAPKKKVDLIADPKKKQQNIVKKDNAVTVDDCIKNLKQEKKKMEEGDAKDRLEQHIKNIETYAKLYTEATDLEDKIWYKRYLLNEVRTTNDFFNTKAIASAALKQLEQLLTNKVA